LMAPGRHSGAATPGGEERVLAEEGLTATAAARKQAEVQAQTKRPHERDSNDLSTAMETVLEVVFQAEDAVDAVEAIADSAKPIVADPLDADANKKEMDAILAAQDKIKEARKLTEGKIRDAKSYTLSVQKLALSEYSSLRQRLDDAQKKLSPYKTSMKKCSAEVKEVIAARGEGAKGGLEPAIAKLQARLKATKAEASKQKRSAKVGTKHVKGKVGKQKRAQQESRRDKACPRGCRDKPPPIPRPGGAAAPALRAAKQWLSAGAAAAPSAAREPRRAAKRRVNTQSKQSGVPGVTWDGPHKCWRVLWREERRRKGKQFPVLRYVAPGKPHEEAEAEALRAAVAFRKERVRQGNIKVVQARRQSGIKGVNWETSNKAWRVCISVRGKRLQGGNFHPRNNTPEEIERARLEAVECRRRLELARLQVNMREVPDPGQLVERDSSA